ncbi:sensor histidine kinase [Ideonella livida]|uniref:Virulence sensor protein BvgS n=1 Tax=Ideonella livida TaxID=2707176 RepID=A0A7C9TNX0_9BURK|nr:ATP-binding protein [Ideonella livida]NDY92946.1 two-component sensor histidine kinase [Ideonella livida]
MPSTLAPLTPVPSAPPRGAIGLGQRRWRLSVVAMVFTIILLVGTWAMVGLLLKVKWDDTLTAEVRQNTNLSSALQEQTLRVLAATDQAALRLRDAVRAGQGTPDLVRFANETGLAPKILVQLSLVGADGRFMGSNIDPDGTKTGHVDLSEREHVRVHLAPGALPVPGNGLFVGKPVLGKVSKRWTIQLSRRIDGPDGQALGVVVASLDPVYFEDVYRSVSLGTQGGVTLVGRDLNIRARVLGGESVGMGSNLGRESPLARSELAPFGHFISASTLDGIERISAYRQVGDYPLYVAVATGLEEALESWRDTRNLVVLLAGLVSLALVATAVIFQISLRRLEKAHEALKDSEAQAQSANRAKSEFLAAISHELRTPLTSILGFSELMERRLDNPKFKEQAGLIRKGAEHLNRLLSEILDLAKVEAGAMAIHPEPEAVMPLVQGTADFFALTASAKGLEIRVRIAPDVPVHVRCDGLRVKQVLNNLMSNAIKFTEKGHVLIEVDTAPDHVRFHVVDTGPGIAPELQELIFEKFRQGDDRVSYQHGGTGLGLALSRALAELMGGTLTLYSREGGGARFTLSLPQLD